jgi:hypothetical protein
VKNSQAASAKLTTSTSASFLHMSFIGASR